MSFNAPLKLICEVLDIASNTAELWRKKDIFNCRQLPGPSQAVQSCMD